jgi:hypothetical protein
MPHAIIRGGNGRRHEVDFEDAEIRIEVYSGDETVEIVVEAVNDLPRAFGSPPVCAPQHSKASLLVGARRGGAAEGNARTAASVVVDQRRPATAVCSATVSAFARGVMKKRRISHAVGACSHSARGADPETCMKVRNP